MNLNALHNIANTPAAHQPSVQSTGGWLIDEQGREIAITEQMVQQACRALECSSMAARQAQIRR
ncbi:hypothetical protein BVH74_11500 [Halopseudomonas phragmitis]|uniref:Uncharacterized protein n=2 Tax=Pseudomonadaceae TaxID=135621 RepID=A0A1V0B5Z2_9GAMM|nr:hypothetical protein BVH74_11500 [Halopseudomonas phragmitis]RHW20137.1 hypothetical protein C2846_15020 [Pseudomonas jilinensis]